MFCCGRCEEKTLNPRGIYHKCVSVGARSQLHLLQHLILICFNFAPHKGQKSNLPPHRLRSSSETC